MPKHKELLTLKSDTLTIRQSFENFFRLNGYKYIPQSKIYLDDDHSLFFVNSGMCQLKNKFIGKDPITYDKLMNHQICLRVSGKHNDIDDVGRDSYHLTMFEMLGNWMLKNASKEETIDLAFYYLTTVCQLDKNRLYVTYFEGNVLYEEDIETKNIWKKYFDDSHIIKGNTKDNFWSMGLTGPTGPSTEIHYDLIGNRDASLLVNNDDPSVVELWNLVFMQYNKKDDGSYEKLADMYVDTGLGGERIVMAVQQKMSIYQTDSFKYLFGYAQSLTNADFYTDKYDNNKDIAYRIFVDHIRSCVICLYQGVDFDCNKRGAIIRKIYRRMMTYLYLYLNNGLVEPKMNKSQVFGLIKDILNYFLFEITDTAKPETILNIQNKLIEEEKLHIGKLQNIVDIYKSILKKTKDIKITIEKMRCENGIDPEFVEHINTLRFVRIN